jgi:hypothetical protein
MTERVCSNSHDLGKKAPSEDFGLNCANRLTVGIIAMVMDEERRINLGGDRGNVPAVSVHDQAMSLATRQAKAARRAADLVPVIDDLKEASATSLG